MKFEIKNRWNGEIIFSVEADSWRFAVEAAIKAKTDLRSADLRYADLSYADLRSADLRSANLRSANLSYANLRSANLSYANLRSANLRYADLRYADLSYADLSYANLSYANLRSANLSYANLRSANLRYADLSYADLSYADLIDIRNDFWSILLFARAEVKGLRKALVEGKIDGLVYEGDCACLVGTVAKERKCKVGDLTGNLKPDSTRAAERFFMAIKPGDTPDENPAAKIALEWLDEFIKATK